MVTECYNIKQFLGKCIIPVIIAFFHNICREDLGHVAIFVIIFGLIYKLHVCEL